jgi:hypothetical protein
MHSAGTLAEESMRVDTPAKTIATDMLANPAPISID